MSLFFIVLLVPLYLFYFFFSLCFVGGNGAFLSFKVVFKLHDPSSSLPLPPPSPSPSSPSPPLPLPLVSSLIMLPKDMTCSRFHFREFHVSKTRSRRCYARPPSTSSCFLGNMRCNTEVIVAKSLLENRTSGDALWVNTLENPRHLQIVDENTRESGEAAC